VCPAIEYYEEYLKHLAKVQRQIRYRSGGAYYDDNMTARQDTPRAPIVARIGPAGRPVLERQDFDPREEGARWPGRDPMDIRDTHQIARDDAGWIEQGEYNRR
jgi:hypothetical protein